MCATNAANNFTIAWRRLLRALMAGSEETVTSDH
jgi:hypothetical protein